jgi:hypothetical protein
MKKGRITGRLMALDGEFRLFGTIPAGVMQNHSRQCFCELSFWSRYPISCVLFVDKAAASWCEWWTELMVGIPARRPDVRYLIHLTEHEWRLR